MPTPAQLATLIIFGSVAVVGVSVAIHALDQLRYVRGAARTAASYALAVIGAALGASGALAAIALVHAWAVGTL